MKTFEKYLNEEPVGRKRNKTLYKDITKAFMSSCKDISVEYKGHDLWEIYLGVAEYRLTMKLVNFEEVE